MNGSESAKDVLMDSRPVKGLTDAIPNRMARQTSNYIVIYGPRTDDGAMVFHFYPPGSDPPNLLGEWREDYRIHDRLESAIPKVFDVRFVRATYTDELKSFCIIVAGGRTLRRSLVFC